ncbi:MAG: hypothetical protein WCM76_12050 [Bacteroidota bacterium]
MKKETANRLKRSPIGDMDKSKYLDTDAKNYICTACHGTFS